MTASTPIEVAPLPAVQPDDVERHRGCRRPVDQSPGAVHRHRAVPADIGVGDQGRQDAAGDVPGQLDRCGHTRLRAMALGALADGPGSRSPRHDAGCRAGSRPGSWAGCSPSRSSRPRIASALAGVSSRSSSALTLPSWLVSSRAFTSGWKSSPWRNAFRNCSSPTGTRRIAGDPVPGRDQVVRRELERTAQLLARQQDGLETVQQCRRLAEVVRPSRDKSPPRCRPGG